METVVKCVFVSAARYTGRDRGRFSDQSLHPQHTQIPTAAKAAEPEPKSSTAVTSKRADCEAV